MTEAAIGCGLPLPRTRNRRPILGAILHLRWSASVSERDVVSVHPLRPQRYFARREAFIESAAMKREMNRL